MSRKIVFITGGARSGKSRFALKEASLIPGRKAQRRLDNLTKSPGSLGRLEEFARRLVAITENTMPVYSKWAMVPPMYHEVPARKEGLGKIFTARICMGTVVLSSCMTIIVSVFVSALWLIGEYGPSITPLPFVFPALLYLCGFLSAKYCTGKFGGVTGDIFGAISEISEIFFLLGVSAWLLRSI